MNRYYILGIFGALFVLIAFFISNDEVKRKFLFDEIFNLIGSLFLVIYAWNGKVWPFFVLNVIWVIWSIKTLIKEIILRKEK